MTWMAVAIGGALGSLARYGVSQGLQTRALVSRFPVGTLGVNLAGCFVIGLLAGLVASARLGLRAPAQEFVFVGLLGGFTTFSSFGLDTWLLARDGSVGLAALNVAMHIVGSLVATWLGYQLGARPA
jgi:CrcB protein